jgi:GNAT superfamily N-acetyltransferase
VPAGTATAGDRGRPAQLYRPGPALLDAKPGDGLRPPRTLDSKEMWLAAIAPSGQRLAGSITLNRDTGEIGGSLAPAFRGRGLGTALFAGAAEFAHHHLGIASVLAGADAENAACIGALSAAGFTPAAGPEAHKLPNGRVIASRWFRHESVRPARCVAAPRMPRQIKPFLSNGPG